MRLNTPYKVAFLSLALLAGFFATSPYLSLNTLAQYIEKNEVNDWETRVNTENLLAYSQAVLEAQLKVKLIKDKQSGKLRSTYEDYSFALSQITQLSNKLVSSKGLKHLICGELARFPSLPANHNGACWALDASISWQSLSEVKATFINPETQWKSIALLKRTHLFNWQLSTLELPIEKMLASLDAQLDASKAI